jgi:hypothetical protein
MTTQIVTAAVMVSGELVNLEVTATDGTAANLVTSGTVGAGGGIAATSIGTYANGKTLTAFIQPVSASGVVAWAYLARRGEILACLPTASSEQSTGAIAINPIVLQAGDSIQVLTVASVAGLRQVNYNVILHRWNPSYIFSSTWNWYKWLNFFDSYSIWSRVRRVLDWKNHSQPLRNRF